MGKRGHLVGFPQTLRNLLRKPCRFSKNYATLGSRGLMEAVEQRELYGFKLTNTNFDFRTTQQQHEPTDETIGLGEHQPDGVDGP